MYKNVYFQIQIKPILTKLLVILNATQVNLVTIPI